MLYFIAQGRAFLINVVCGVCSPKSCPADLSCPIGLQSRSLLVTTCENYFGLSAVACVQEGAHLREWQLLAEMALAAEALASRTTEQGAPIFMPVLLFDHILAGIQSWYKFVHEVRSLRFSRAPSIGRKHALHAGNDAVEVAPVSLASCSSRSPLLLTGHEEASVLPLQ